MRSLKKTNVDKYRAVESYLRTGQPIYMDMYKMSSAKIHELSVAKKLDFKWFVNANLISRFIYIYRQVHKVSSKLIFFDVLQLL